MPTHAPRNRERPARPARAESNHRVDLEYLGTRYSGWQSQSNARGIADAFAAACRSVFEDVRQVGAAGRTDAGVHALHQVAHVRSRGMRRGVRHPVLALNDALPADIAVTRVAPASADFDPRRDAVGRVYRYQILTRRSAFASGEAWWVRDPLDEGAMRRAAAALTGRHDFSAFSEEDPQRPRETSLSLEPVELARTGPLLVLRFRARFFLWKMVRRLTGYLVGVGRGTFPVGLAPAVFGQDRRVLAPHTAPPHGLFLERVLYPGDAPPPPLEAGTWTSAAASPARRKPSANP